MRHELSVIMTVICAGDDDSEEVFTFPDADPYLAEDRAFLDAVTTRDESTVLSTYSDAAKTYCLSCSIRTASIAI